jgi:protein-tyrosine phosphatase
MKTRLNALCLATLLLWTVAFATTAHQQLVPLQGGRNFRDLGGYRTEDGHTVKWGELYRSGSMHDLTPSDFAYLGRLGIRTVCDFRDVHERAVEPVSWPTGKAPNILADDYDLGRIGMFPSQQIGTWDAERTRQYMASTYPKLLSAFNGQYRRMFRQLLAHQVPLAFNCSAGKDRTGIAAALILTSLGVPRDTVIQDYLLTNKYLQMDSLSDSPATAAWAKLPAPVLKQLSVADRSYIESALAVLERHRGGPMGYLQDELQLSPADIQKLRNLYLE